LPFAACLSLHRIIARGRNLSEGGKNCQQQPNLEHTMTEAPLPYEVDGKAFEALLVRPEGDATPKAAVAVCHAWGGRDAFSEAVARRLAAEGYLACALDAYGAGVRGTTPEENQALMAPLVANRGALFRRLTTGLAALRAQPDCGDAVAALGYCFGGLCVLDLARGGAGLRGVVSFHGLLHAPQPALGPGDDAAILVLNGHDDPMVPPSAVQAFTEEMTLAERDWQVHDYGGALHAFTVPEANAPEAGVAYQERAAAAGPRPSPF
jgi:dienelactone hydrolase